MYLVLYRGGRKDHGLIEFPFQPFLNHLQVEKAEEAAAEAEAKRGRGIFLVDQGSVVDDFPLRRFSVAFSPDSLLG